VTQQNAALVEEAAAAAESLEDQARALVGVVARFRLENSATQQVAPPARKVTRSAAPLQRKGPGVKQRQAPAAFAGRAEPRQSSLAEAAEPDDDWKEF
jgi:methyl-accepting chemotaxis protein